MIIHTVLRGPWTFLYPSHFSSLPPSASKTNRNSGKDNGAHVNELPDKGYEASSKRLGTHSECQFDIFDQLRKRIKQSFFSLWCPFNVRRNQSYGVHKKLCVFHCAVNIAVVRAFYFLNISCLLQRSRTKTFTLRGKKSNKEDHIKW